MKSVSTPNPGMEFDHHGHEWLALFLILIVGAGAFFWRQSVVAPAPAPRFTPIATVGRPVGWFFMLRMPPLTSQYESGIQTLRVRYGEWLDGLTKAGFHPMRYSDVCDRLKRGQGVPEKTVVLVFDPGLRRTYELIAPTLQAKGWPALWLTDGRAMRHGHREYVTYHTADRMVRSGWWDVGYTQSNGAVTLATRDHGSYTMAGTRARVWSPMAGGLAFNRGSFSETLQYLNVNSDWTSDDLLNRVLVEVPVAHPSYLIKRPVQNLTWGISTEDAASTETRFDLQSSPHKNSFVLNWFGTKGLPDFELNAQARRLIGKCCLRLRWDEARGNGILLLISNREVFVQELVNFKAGPATHLPASEGPGFRVHAALRGSNLSVSVDDRQPVQIYGLSVPEAGRGLLQLFLFDKFRGSARADGVEIQFSPMETLAS